MELHQGLADPEATLATSERRQAFIAEYDRLSRDSTAMFTQLVEARADRGLDADYADLLEDARTLKESCVAVEELSGGRDYSEDAELHGLEELRQRTLKAAIARGPGADVTTVLSEAIADPSVGAEPPVPSAEAQADARRADLLANTYQLVAETRALTEGIRREQALAQLPDRLTTRLVNEIRSVSPIVT